MLVTMKEILDKAMAGKYAVGAFNVPNLESIQATIEAAEELGVPVIIQHAQVHEDEGLITLDEIGPTMVDYAKRAKVPVCVHLDHGVDFDYLVRAMHMGFTSVMIDASAKPYEENLAITKEVCKVAHALNVSVEAELGALFNSAVGSGGRAASSLDDYDSADEVYTNPKQAKEFIEATGVDALAIAFGTVHGVYLTKPALDLDRVKLIHDACGIPLVMHGGSGVSDEDNRTAINNGITKINYYTYGTMAGANAVRDYLATKAEGEKIFFHDIVAEAKKGIKADVKRAMEIFATNLLAAR